MNMCVFYLYVVAIIVQYMDQNVMTHLIDEECIGTFEGKPGHILLLFTSVCVCLSVKSLQYNYRILTTFKIIVKTLKITLAQNSACKIRYIYQILPSEYYPNSYI